ncbi:MAG: hypothetical protein RI991_1058 [Bacteroidota bacterium]
MLQIDLGYEDYQQFVVVLCIPDSFRSQQFQYCSDLLTTSALQHKNISHAP